MAQYRVCFVEDDEFPAGVEWAIVPRTPDGLGPFLFVRESAVTGAALSDAWRAWQRYERGAYSSSRNLPAASNACRIRSSSAS